MEYGGKSILLADLESDDVAAFEQLFDDLVTRGFSMVKAEPTLRSLLEDLEAQASHFFEKSSIQQKEKLCCEYSTPQKLSRDRLELRRPWATRNEGHRLVPCLKRDQFVSGYDINVSEEAMASMSTFFPDEKVEEAFDRIENIGNIVCKAVLQRLGLDFEALLAQEASLSEHGQTNFSASILRVLRYPRAQAARETERAEADQGTPLELAQDHTDLGLVTIMPCSSVPSLEILDPTTYEWISIEKHHNRGDIAIVVGEQMAFLSHYRIPPARHRVLQPSLSLSKDRISFPFLQRLSPNVSLCPASTANGEKSPIQLQPKMAKEIANHIFELPLDLQRSIQRSLALMNALEAFYSSKSSSSNGGVIAAMHLQPNVPSARPLLVSEALLSALVVVVNKMPSRAQFISLQKYLQTQSDLKVGLKARFSKKEDWCFRPDVSVQLATFQEENEDPSTALGILFVSDAFLFALKAIGEAERLSDSAKQVLHSVFFPHSSNLHDDPSAEIATLSPLRGYPFIAALQHQ